MQKINTNGRIECLMERMIRESSFTLIHDGQFEKPKDVQARIPPEERRFFTRHYRKVRNNRFVDEWIIFRYDIREGFCVECNVTKKQPGLPKQEQKMITKELLMRS